MRRLVLSAAAACLAASAAGAAPSGEAPGAGGAGAALVAPLSIPGLAEAPVEAGDEMLMAKKAGKPRVSFAQGSMGTSAYPWHVVAYDAASTKDRTISKALFIHVLNDFAWCAGEEKVLVPPPAPPPVSGLRIVVRDCVGATAKDVLPCPCADAGVSARSDAS